MFYLNLEEDKTEGESNSNIAESQKHFPHFFLAGEVFANRYSGQTCLRHPFSNKFTNGKTNADGAIHKGHDSSDDGQRRQFLEVGHLA